MYFIKDGCLIKVVQTVVEPYEQYLERVNFILSQKPKTDLEFEKAETYSYVYINKKYIGSEYSVQTEDQLKSMCLNLFKS